MVVSKTLCGVPEKLKVFLSKYDSAIEIPNARVFWVPGEGVLGVICSKEWSDYLTDEGDLPGSQAEFNIEEFFQIINGEPEKEKENE